MIILRQEFRKQMREAFLPSDIEAQRMTDAEGLDSVGVQSKIILAEVALRANNGGRELVGSVTAARRNFRPSIADPFSAEIVNDAARSWVLTLDVPYSPDQQTVTPGFTRSLSLSHNRLSEERITLVAAGWMVFRHEGRETRTDLLRNINSLGLVRGIVQCSMAGDTWPLVSDNMSEGATPEIAHGMNLIAQGGLSVIDYNLPTSGPAQ
jgi:hypothetical protein